MACPPLPLTLATMLVYPCTYDINVRMIKTYASQSEVGVEQVRDCQVDFLLSTTVIRRDVPLYCTCATCFENQMT